MPKRTLTALFLMACLAGAAYAASPEEAVRPIQDTWADIKYHTPEKQQAERYHSLAQQAHRLSESLGGRPEPLIWEAIVLSSEAGAEGGLGALSLAKEAKRLLESAIKLDDKALSGSAYTSLGTLYAKVPGWPIGFGDKTKAEELLKKSLTLNPSGIDPNFFYGDYLAERGRYQEAQRYLEVALKAPPRPGREMADTGRHQEILALMTKVKRELND